MGSSSEINETSTAPNSGNKKADFKVGFFVHLVYSSRSGHSLDVLVQAALVTSGLVSVDDAFAGHAINDRHSGFVGFNSIVFVTSGNRLDDVLDVCAQLGAQARIVLAMCFRLADALSSLCRVSQSKTPRKFCFQ